MSEKLESARAKALEALEYVYSHIADPARGPRDLYPAFGLNASRAIELTRDAIEAVKSATPSPSQPIDGGAREAVLERALRRRIADLEGVLRYLKTQAVSGTLHPQVVIQNVDMALRGIRAALPAQTPWRDMDCAPKDGTRVLLAVDDDGERFLLTLGQWESGFDAWNCDLGMLGERDETWIEGFHEWPVTHWMPLPSPPKAEPKDEEA